MQDTDDGSSLFTFTGNLLFCVCHFKIVKYFLKEHVTNQCLVVDVVLFFAMM